MIFDTGKTKNVLHIAPETNLSNKLFSAQLNSYVCGDLFTEGYDYPERVEKFSILDIPYPNNHFDLVICNHVLEHIADDRKAMSELNRVLRKGGLAILQVPISENSYETFEDSSVTESKQKEIIFGQYDHMRIYGQDYFKRLNESGFEVERINIVKEFPYCGLNIKEDLFICRK